MFFNGGSFNQNVNFRRAGNNNRNNQQNNQRDGNQRQVRANKFTFLLQLLPLVLLYLISVIPSLFQTVIFTIKNLIY